MNDPALSLGKQQSRANQLPRLSEAFHRRVAHDFFDALGLKNLAVLFGGEEPGHEHVDAYTMRRPFAREIQRQVVHGAFRRGVGEHAGERHHTRHRSDIDD